MSHAQADGAGAVGTLFFAFAKFGLTNWLDMRQQDITLEGMKKGVRDSRIFLLFLTSSSPRPSSQDPLHKCTLSVSTLCHPGQSQLHSGGAGVVE